MSTPFMPPSWWLSGTNQNSIPANDNALRFWISQANVDNATTAQPASPAEGQCHIIQAVHTGAQWSAFSPKDLAIFSGGTWYAFTPGEGNRVSVSGAVYVYKSGAWTAASVGGMTNPMTNAGDMIVGAASGAPARLAAGANGYVLTLAAGVPTWAAATGGFSNPMTAVGDLIVGGVLGVAGRLAAGTANFVLTSAGPGAAPTWQAIPGGGGLSNWTEGVSASAPNVSIPVASLVPSSTSSSVDVALAPKGNGALLAAVPNNLASGGNKRGAKAVDLQIARDVAAHVASGGAAAIGGGQSNQAGGFCSTVPGGRENSTPGEYSFAAGRTNTAAGAYSAVTGGQNNDASGQWSRVGGANGSSRAIQGADIFGLAGGGQRGFYGLARVTSNATQAVATTGANAVPDGSNQITLANNSAMTFSGHVVAKRAGSVEAKHWKFEGGIMRGAGAGTTALTGSIAAVAVAESAGAAAWTVDIDADTTLGCLRILVTGEAGKNINWVVSVGPTVETWSA